MTSADAAPLMREIRRITEDRDRLERRQRRIDTAIAQALVMLRQRPERV